MLLSGLLSCEKLACLIAGQIAAAASRINWICKNLIILSKIEQAIFMHILFILLLGGFNISIIIIEYLQLNLDYKII